MSITMDRPPRPADLARYTGRDYAPRLAFWRSRRAAMEDPVLLVQDAGEMAGRADRPLSEAAAATLARISGGSALGRLVVLAASVARVLAAEGGGTSILLDTPPLADAPHAGEMLPLALPPPRGTVRALLSSVRDVVAEGFANQDFPIRRLALPDAPDAPVLVVEEALQGALPAATGHFATIALSGPRLRVSHRAGAEAAEALAGRIDRALAGFHDTDRDIATIELLSAGEVASVTRWGRGPAVDGPRATIWDLFRATAERHADRVAVRDGGHSVTYAGLLRGAETLALALRRDHGVAPGALVGLVTARRLEWIVGMLGIMAAGGAYVPLNADDPSDRLAGVLDEARPAVVLSALPGQPIGPPLADALALPVAPVTEPKPTIPGPTIPGPTIPGPVPSDLAYVLFTSGSTGRPKGVLIEHAGFADMIRHQIAVFGIGAEDRVLQLASASFDASMSEVFLALLSGAALVLVADAVVADPARFLAHLAREGVTVATITPAHLAALDGAALPGLRVLIMAGDAASAAMARRYAANHAVYNAYGPTETSVCASIHRVPTGARGETVPVGRPVAGGRIHVLDPFGQLRPPGAPGEIVFAGPGVARGYLGRDSEAFIADPFPPSGATPDRAYRTGDLGRFRDDGELEFLGRIDRQIKIGGHRIEPAEIERALLAHPLAREAHVTPVRAPGGQTELVAYVVPREAVELWPSIAEFHVYDDLAYGAMAEDARRNASYRAAFERHLPGRTVLEIGPGAQAVLSRMAIAAGARRVYAVEISPRAAEQARARLRAEGLADRVEIITGDIATVTLPELADVCISEIVGGIGGSEGSAVLIEASRTWLRDGAAQIPARSLTRIAGLSLAGLEDDLAFPEAAVGYVERIFAQAGRRFDLRLCLKHLPASRVVTGTDVLEDLDYRAPLATASRHAIGMEVTAPGRIDAFLVWLRLVIDADHPEEAIDILESDASWLPVCLALDQPSPMLAVGDRVEAVVTRTLSANGLNPDFRVEGRFARAGETLSDFVLEAPHAAPGFRRGALHRAAFDGDGQPRRAAPLTDRLRAHLTGSIPRWMMPAHIVVLRALPLNASGKIDRRALPAPARPDQGVGAQPRDHREAVLAAVFAGVLGVASVGIEDDFFALGGDSIRAIQVAARLGAKGFRLDSADILQRRTVAALAPLMRGGAVARGAALGPASGPFPLTPVQAWFFAQPPDRPAHFNQSVLLRAAERLDPEAVAAALDALAAHHDMLRGRFPGTGQGDIAATQPPTSIEVIDTGPDGLQAACDRVQASLDLATGPIFRAAVLRLPDADRLLWVVHHLAVDAVSWRILLEDMERAFAAVRRGGPPELPPRTDSFADWARAVAERAGGRDLAADRAYWTRPGHAGTARLPIADGPDLMADAETLSATLPADKTAALLRVAGADTQDLLLAALAGALRDIAGPGTFPVLLEGHGREASMASLDVSRTVGWFTTFFPVLLDLSFTDTATGIRLARDAVASVPNRGTSYLLLAGQPGGVPPTPAQLSFNYLGRFDDGGGNAMFEVAAEAAGAAVSPGARRPVPVELLASVADGSVRVGLTFNRRLADAAMAGRLLDGFMRALAEIAGAADAVPPDVGFAMAGLDAAGLDDLLQDWT